MSKKKNRKRVDSDVAATEALVPTDAPETRAVSLKVPLIMAGALAVWGLLLLLLGMNNKLLWAKIIVGWLLGLTDPSDLGANPGSSDLAIILFFGALVGCAGWLHPALGIGILALLRPWLDGYTFPTDNTYFLWGILYCFTVWAARALFRGEGIRHGAMLLLLAAYIGIVSIGIGTSINFADTYEAILLWMAYFFLFLTVSNSIRDTRIAAAFMGLLALVFFAENLFSILQFEYLMPFLRVLLRDRPDVLAAFFGESEVTPELANRLNRNRAFGTMLFPNAMAAFLILAIPFAAATALEGWRRLGPAWRSGMPLRKRAERKLPLFWALLAALVAGGLVFFTAQFPGSYATGSPPWFADLYAAATLGAVAGCAAGAGVFTIMARRGVLAAGRLVQALVQTLATALLIYGLAITYSRGAMLALAAAAVAGLVLYHATPRRIPRALRRLAGVAALLIALGPLLVALHARAQDAAPAPVESANTAAAPAAMPKPELTAEGVNLAMSDLADPATAQLRLDYWRVAWRMFKANPWFGVGMGNFEWAFPIHQKMGEGDVREAHSSVLQALSETGIFATAALAAFWIFWLLWAMRRLIATEDRDVRLILAGLLVGVLAFLLHSLIDINLQHPSLMFFAMSVTGLFTALASMNDHAPRQEPRNAGRSVGVIVLIPLLLAAALAFGSSMRPYMQRLALSRASFMDMKGQQQKELDHRQAVMEFFLKTVDEWGDKPTARAPQIPMRSAMRLIWNADELSALGPIYIPDPTRPRGWMQLQVGQPIPAEAVLMVQKPWLAQNTAKKYALLWLAELERQDGRWPHDPQLAAALQRGYALLAETLDESQHQQEQVLSMVGQFDWAKEAVERNPYFGDAHVILAQAFWRRSWIERGLETQLKNYHASLPHLERAVQLAPNIPQYYGTYAYAWKQIARLEEARGDSERQKKALAEAAEWDKRNAAIWDARGRLRR